MICLQACAALVIDILGYQFLSFAMKPSEEYPNLVDTGSAYIDKPLANEIESPNVTNKNLLFPFLKITTKSLSSYIIIFFGASFSLNILPFAIRHKA